MVKNKEETQTTEVRAAESVKLKDTETSFYDEETRLSVVREAVVPLKKPFGKRTAAALVTGALIRVAAPKEAKKKEA